MSNTTQNGSSKVVRWLVIAVVAVLALLGSYGFAVARGTSGATARAAGAYKSACARVAGAGRTGAGAGTSAGQAAAGAGCGCCGGTSNAPADPITGSAAVSGDVQRISVDVSKGYYDPNTIELKAGVPAEITFGQASGCLGAVQSQDLDFYQDLTAGPATVKLPGLEPGTYTFSCGMQMVFGTIVVK